jgi:site-specific DNA-methyltransferase (adenine-specific)
MDTRKIDTAYRLYASNQMADNCVIFCWTTNSMLPEALTLIKSWGYEYKTMITWIKTNCLGMGAWFRGNTEHLLLGVKGKVKAFHCQKKNYIEHPRLQHSEKPEVFRDLIEKVASSSFEKLKCLELFGRGWKFYNDNWTAINAVKGLEDPLTI